MQWQGGVTGLWLVTGWWRRLQEIVKLLPWAASELIRSTNLSSLLWEPARDFEVDQSSSVHLVSYSYLIFLFKNYKEDIVIMQNRVYILRALNYIIKIKILSNSRWNRNENKISNKLPIIRGAYWQHLTSTRLKVCIIHWNVLEPPRTSFPPEQAITGGPLPPPPPSSQQPQPYIQVSSRIHSSSNNLN